jgi:hypothetical protein
VSSAFLQGDISDLEIARRHADHVPDCCTAAHRIALNYHFGPVARLTGDGDVWYVDVQRIAQCIVPSWTRIVVFPPKLLAVATPFCDSATVPTVTVSARVAPALAASTPRQDKETSLNFIRLLRNRGSQPEDAFGFVRARLSECRSIVQRRCIDIE